MAMRKTAIIFHSVLLFVLSFGLRVWTMNSESPSFEEMVANTIAVRPPPDYVGLAQPDFCPPIYYSALHGITLLSKDLWAGRLLSILLGVATALAMFHIARILYGSSAGVIAGYLMALQPLHLFVSQQAQPDTLFVLVLLGTFFFMIRSAESNRPKDWVIYDIACVILLHSQRESIFCVGAFLILQLCRAAFFPPTDDQRRIRRIWLVQAILFNHLIIGAISLPWLWIMPTALPWPLEKPSPSQLADMFSDYLLVGVTGWKLSWLPHLLLGIYLFLIPPMLNTLRRRHFRTFAAFFALLLILLLPFAYSQVQIPRFVPIRAATAAAPFFVLSLAVFFARCNPVVRLVLFGVFSGIFLAAVIGQAYTPQNPQYTAMRNAILQRKATEKDVAVFWPDYSLVMGDYWRQTYGKQFGMVAASELLEHWAGLPENGRLFFVISQFPSSTPHLYTFQGALARYSTHTIRWQDRLNAVIEATDIDKMNLSLWYKDPDSLKIIDQPTPDTQFIFPATDPAFRNAQFHRDREDLMYEADGRRCVWMKTGVCDLNLTVTLAPGRYVVKLHCAPDFIQPEYNRSIKRVLNVELLSGVPRKKSVVENETTLHCTIDTDTELSNLKLRITAEPVLTVPSPGGGTFGLKIYSISIDQEAETKE
jgi:hypothetical protein